MMKPFIRTVVLANLSFLSAAAFAAEGHESAAPTARPSTEEPAAAAKSRRDEIAEIMYPAQVKYLQIENRAMEEAKAHPEKAQEIYAQEKKDQEPYNKVIEKYNDELMSLLIEETRVDMTKWAKDAGATDMDDLIEHKNDQAWIEFKKFSDSIDINKPKAQLMCDMMKLQYFIMQIERGITSPIAKSSAEAIQKKFHDGMEKLGLGFVANSN